MDNGHLLMGNGEWGMGDEEEEEEDEDDYED